VAQPVYEVKGAREMRKTLKAAGDDLADLKVAHAAAAQTVATTARPTTPFRTGALAASMRPGATKTAAIIRAGGARVPYANVIHWGWKAHKIAPQPWIVDAAIASQAQWEAQYEDAVSTVLQRIRGV
jgi:hypothetical protein